MAKGMGGRPPRIIFALKDEEIVELGKKAVNSSEDDILRSIGLKERLFNGVKHYKRWRYNFDKGKAIGKTEYNERLLTSGEAAVQRMIAEHTLPQIETIEEGYEFIIDAPEWFKKGIGGKKRGRPIEEAQA